MKRTLCLLSALLLAVVWFMPAQALAEEQSVLLQVATVSGEVGTTVDVVVSMSNCVGVDSTEFDINYNPSAISVVSVTPGNIFPAEYCVSYTGNPGKIGVACAQRFGFTGDGTLLTIRFEIIGASGSPLTITTHLPLTGDHAGEEVTQVDADYNQSAALVVIENGGVTVGEAPLPAPLVTPWAPATPVPTPSPTPEPTPEATQSLQTQAQPDATAATAAQALSSLNPAILYVGGGLLAAIAVLVVILLSRKKRY